MRGKAFLAALVGTVLGMGAATIWGTGTVVLLVLAIGLTVMLVSTTARRSTFQVQYRSARFVLSCVVMAATLVAMTYAGALASIGVVLTTLIVGSCVAFATLCSVALPGKRRSAWSELRRAMSTSPVVRVRIR